MTLDCGRLDLVVKGSGVGNATVYRQFPNKEALASTYTQDRADAWFARMRQASDQVDDPREKLLAIFTAASAPRAPPSAPVSSSVASSGLPVTSQAAPESGTCPTNRASEGVVPPTVQA
ncbi:TetR/AcrR family transcriptional regulator [Streptomyces sp. NPDC052036]|uniref:TetR/AcrR family transcriptional regulator n=1 Tax=Streptomyces sp. NPDC052036 TaxID=3155171 RepID=UPI00342A32DD